METSTSKFKAMLIHLSTFGQYVFPLGNFVFPIVLWSITKKDSDFIDRHGKQAINFQLSVFTYTLILAIIAIPIALLTIFKHVPIAAMFRDEDVFIHNFSFENIGGMVTLAVIAVVLFFFLKVAEFFLIIYAAMQAAEGRDYKYPLTIPFLAQSTVEENQEPQVSTSIS